MKVEVTRYRKPNGFLTRHWAVFVNGELLAVTLYRKGALAVAVALTGSKDACPVLTSGGRVETSPGTVPRSEA
jgi:hypothetical protein